MTNIKTVCMVALLLVATAQALVPSGPKGSTYTSGQRSSSAVEVGAPMDWFEPAAPKGEERVGDFFRSIMEQLAPLATGITDEGTKAKAPPTTAWVSSTVFAGKVSWYRPKMGYGFIGTEESGFRDQVFVHQSELQADGFRSLMEGERVEFRVAKDRKGRLRAVHVTGPEGGDLAVTTYRNQRIAEINEYDFGQWLEDGMRDALEEEP